MNIKGFFFPPVYFRLDFTLTRTPPWLAINASCLVLIWLKIWGHFFRNNLCILANFLGFNTLKEIHWSYFHKTKCHWWCVFRQPQTTDLTPAMTINQCQSGYQMVKDKTILPTNPNKFHKALKQSESSVLSQPVSVSLFTAALNI